MGNKDSFLPSPLLRLEERVRESPALNSNLMILLTCSLKNPLNLRQKGREWVMEYDITGLDRDFREAEHLAAHYWNVLQLSEIKIKIRIFPLN